MTEAHGKAVAVVTGASSGIGRATAVSFAQRGLSVLCVGRDQERLNETMATIGGEARAVSADISHPGGIETIAGEVGPRLVMAIAHCAGREALLGLAATDRESFVGVIDANLAAPFFLTQALLERLADGSAVVFVSSIAATCGSGGRP
jgi:NAD(P)-dependent dehydrogenase (short-subunit alcohol dehydrogenase family)